jgi:hypothetical protein
MHKLPPNPANPRPQGIKINLPKPTLIDSMEQKAYSFKPFLKWFAVIEPRKLSAGDYSIAGLENRVAVEGKSLPDLFTCCSPYGSREAFVRACERLSLGKLDFAALVIEGSITKILRTTEYSRMHPNAEGDYLSFIKKSGILKSEDQTPLLSLSWKFQEISFKKLSKQPGILCF